MIKASVVINRPIEEVFDRVVDLESAPQWQGELVHVRDVSNSPIGAGTTMTTVLRFLGRNVENIMRVSRYAPPTHFSLATVSGYLPVDLHFILEPVANGTRVTYLSDWELPRGIPFRLVRPAKPLFDRMDQREWQANLARLKALMEARTGVGA